MINKAKSTGTYLYNHLLVRYLFVGGSTFILDFCLLIFFHQELGMVLWLATFLANFIALTYNFLLNRFWAFSSSEKDSLRRHLVPYVLTAGANLLFSVLFVSIIGTHISYKIAKVLAVAIQTTWTYKIYKDYIFVKKDSDIKS